MTPSQRETFERLAREHAGAVYRTARRVVARDDLAEEVTQEVFLRVLAHPETYLDRPGIEPSRALRWLAVKKGLEVLRAGRNRVRREELAMEGSTATTPPHDDPGARGESREVQAALSEALARLPDELRLAVSLRFQESWTFAEIAAAAEVSEPTAHDRVRRGIEKLRGWLTSAGFGAAAVAVERALENAAPPVAPAGLAARMASLGASAGAGIGAGSGLGALSSKATTALVAGTLGAVLVSVAAGLGFGIERADGAPRSESARTVDSTTPLPGLIAATEPTAAAGDRADAVRTPAAPPPPGIPVAREEAGAPPPPQGQADPFAALGRATLSGQVTLDRDDRALLPSVRVVAVSLRHASKGDRPRWTSAVNADGTYSLSLPVEDDGAYFESWIEYAGARLAVGPERRLAPDVTVDDHDFVFGKRIGERAGEFSLLATVVDENGAPRANESIVLYRVVAYAGDQPFAAAEATATTDARGRARLEGKWLGPKRLSLGPWLGERWSPSVDFELDRPGAQERSFALKDLPPAEPEARVTYTISGRVVDAASGEPLLDEYHSVETIAPPPDLPAASWREDWLPNAAWLPPSRQVAVAFDAKPTDRFVAAADAPGEYFLVAWRRPYAPVVAGPFDVRATNPITDATVAFEKCARLRGKVVDDRGAPLARAHLVITGVGPFSERRVAQIDDRVEKQSGDGYVHGSAARTDADGRFELDAAPIGTPFRIVALHADRMPAGTGWLTVPSAGSLEELTIALPDARR